MQRLIAPAVILWLAAFGAVQAQTSATPSSTTTTGTAAGTTAPGSSASVTGPTLANQPTSGGTSLNDTPCSSTSQPAGGTGTGCGSDPLNVPAKTIPTTVPIPQPNAENSDSSPTVGMSASAPVNPQRAAQLPGEGSNTSTQTANTSAPVSSTSGSQPCPAGPTTASGASMSGVFGGASGGSC